MNPLQAIANWLQSSSTHSFRKPGVQQAQVQAIPQSTAVPTPQATPINISEDRLRQNISNTWGKDTPLLQNLATYIQGGNKLPGNMDKLLILALALRETQGGKDLLDPAKMKDSQSGLGDNNVFNIRNDQGAFQNYPDERTAVMGNLEQGGQSGGAVGLLGGTKPSSEYIYKNFRRTNDYKDLFKKWSPPSDSNGSLEEQTQNIMWILNQLKK